MHVNAATQRTPFSLLMLLGNKLSYAHLQRGSDKTGSDCCAEGGGRRQRENDFVTLLDKGEHVGYTNEGTMFSVAQLPSYCTNTYIIYIVLLNTKSIIVNQCPYLR